ncbi:hypothetical protein IEQ34_010156 [Dendrobium chrysotoxum]|uniref:Uncharacterized protein n=1 Tax=Dendrobium chrysotoxum TaxID=161865 RepID=A0AAV7H0R7_DENCH|nr:hypothetical protein IEQ34_010156 [Dendrobium chrysotoxum]
MKKVDAEEEEEEEEEEEKEQQEAEQEKVEERWKKLPYRVEVGSVKLMKFVFVCFGIKSLNGHYW